MELPIVESTISSIAEVIEYFPAEHQGVVVAFDWDETTILGNGDDKSGLRENKITKGVFEILQEREFDAFILTSRYGGCSLEEIDKKYIPKKSAGGTVFSPTSVKYAMQNVSKAMINEYELFDQEYRTFCFSSCEEPHCLVLNDATLGCTSPWLGNDTALIAPNMVFAGSRENTVSNKGKVMTRLLDFHAEAIESNELDDAIFASKRPISHVIFVDNDYEHIKQMRAAFENRPEHLTLLYYPLVVDKSGSLDTTR